MADQSPECSAFKAAGPKWKPEKYPVPSKANKMAHVFDTKREKIRSANQKLSTGRTPWQNSKKKSRFPRATQLRSNPEIRKLSEGKTDKPESSWS